MHYQVEFSYLLLNLVLLREDNTYSVEPQNTRTVESERLK